MINCNELTGLDVDMDTNIQNIACLGKIMSINNKQHLKVQSCKLKKH